MQENKELYFGYFKHISQNIIFNDYVNLLPLNSYNACKIAANCKQLCWHITARLPATADNLTKQYLTQIGH